MQNSIKNLGVTTDLDVLDQCLKLADQFVIDAGCGNMHLSKALADRGAHVLAIDPDPIQAEKNRQAKTIANVGFAETGADQIPVENQSVDGVVFSYSLHHVPSDLYPQVFSECLRILKPDGFLYIIEPVASGDLNEVMRLFHDEAQVRAQAQLAIEKHGVPNFASTEVFEYKLAKQYRSWEQFADGYAAKSFNTGYTEAQVRSDAVREKFISLGEPTQFAFESPMRATWLQGPRSTRIA